MSWPQPDPEQIARALEWLRSQDPQLNLKRLAGALGEAGYDAAVVTAAVARRQAELDAALPKGSDLRARAAAIVVVAFLATFAALSIMLLGYFQDGWQWRGFGPVAVLVLGALLGTILLLSLLGIAISGRLRRGLAGALATVLAIPFILLVIVAGLCVVTTNGLRV